MRNRRSPQKARWAISTALALFLLSQAVLAGLAVTRARVIRDPVYYTQLGNLKKKVSASPTPPRLVLFLGTSRTEFGVRAKPLERELSGALGEPVAVVNWGKGGWNLVRPLLAADRLLREGIRPDLVVVEVLPTQLAAGTPLDTVHPKLPIHELDAADLALVRRHDPSYGEGLEERLTPVVAPLHAYRENILRVFSPRLLPPDPGRPLNTLGEDLELRLSPEAWEQMREGQGESYSKQYREFLLSESHVAIYEDLLKRLKAKGIPVLVTVMPEGPFCQTWCPAPTRRLIDSAIAGLANRNEVPFLDFRDWVGAEEDFHDSHHLTPEAGERFCSRLGREVILPRLRRP